MVPMTLLFLSRLVLSLMYLYLADYLVNTESECLGKPFIGLCSLKYSNVTNIPLY